jgi:hypothetical protein
MAVDSTLRQRTNGSAQASKFVVTEEGKEADKRLDNHETYVLIILPSFQVLISCTVLNLVVHGV